MKADRAAGGATVRVYRCQLVEERLLPVPNAKAASSGQAAAILRRFLDKADREHFVVLLLDRANAVLGVHTVAMGNHERVVVSVREAFKAAILHNADRIVVAHNHVGSSAEPSEADKQLTAALLVASQVLGIDVADHVILSRGEFFSFRDHDWLDKRRRPRRKA